MPRTKKVKVVEDISKYVRIEFLFDSALKEEAWFDKFISMVVKAYKAEDRQIVRYHIHSQKWRTMICIFPTPKASEPFIAWAMERSITTTIVEMQRN